MKRIVIEKKYIYMLFLFVICLLGVVLVPTFAKFTQSYTTEEDIVGLAFDFEIGISNIEEYEEINVASGENIKFNVEITNSSSSTAYYGIWYKLVSPSELPEGVTIARLDGTGVATSGSIDNGAAKTATIVVLNSSDDNLKINIGVASSTTSTEDIEYLGGRKLISDFVLPSDAVTFGGSYISLTPTLASYTINLTIGAVTINPQELNLWRFYRERGDGTLEIISEYVSSTAVPFEGEYGYRNLIRDLNRVASLYENSDYTTGSRHFGFVNVNQTESLVGSGLPTSVPMEVPLACSTGGDCYYDNDPTYMESQGFGDQTYREDYNNLYQVFGTRVATDVNGTKTTYWMASRYYYYGSEQDFRWCGRVINTEGAWGYDCLVLAGTDYYSYSLLDNSVRPILYLKDDLVYTGMGTESDPFVPFSISG